MKWIWPDQKNIPLIDWIYKTRDIVDKDRFLNPTFEDIHDPFKLHDIDKAVKAIKESIENKEKIVIYGDYDVDGISATSTLWSFLNYEANADVIPYIPSRFTEGYGLSEEGLDKIVDMGAKLVISVDCGIKDIELVKKYSSKLKFVITDHHTVREASDEKVAGSKKVGKYFISSKALAVVHPMLNDYPFKEICGAAVSWKLCAALNTYLNLEVDMVNYLDLTALGTVCDVMPLVDENRSIVKLGLERIRQGSRVGIKELMKVAKVDPLKIQSFHLGFVLGPRLNASGRLEDAMDGVRLLTTQSTPFAHQLALKLDALNNQRKDLTKKYLDISEGLVEKDLNKKFLFVVGDEWPEGILGLIAGKLADKYNRPVIVASKKDGVIKGSARSIESFHIANVLKDLSPLLLSHGGHSQAAGLSLSEKSYEELYKSIQDKADEVIKDEDMVKLFRIDGAANLDDLTESTVQNLSLLEPFGERNLQPLIGLKNVIIKNYNFLGADKTHVKLNFLNHLDESIDAIGFGMSLKLTSLLDGNSLYSAPLDLAGSLEINEWRGNKTLTLKLQDFKISD